MNKQQTNTAADKEPATPLASLLPSKAETRSNSTETKAPVREVLLDESEEAEPGVYPQQDGTVNVVLNTPIKRSSGEPIAVVKILGMPLVKDMNKAGGRMQLLQMVDSAHMIVAPTITEPTINPKTWEAMDIADTTNLMGGILHFFVSSKNKGNATA